MHARDSWLRTVFLAISPVMFGGGQRLFAGIGRDVGVELVETVASPHTTHVRYAVRRP